MKTKNSHFVGLYNILDEFKLSNYKKLYERVGSLDLRDLESLYLEVMTHHKKSKQAITNELRKPKFTVYPENGRVEVPSFARLGSQFFRIIAPFDESFLRAVCLYADLLIIHDPLSEALNLLNQGEKLRAVRWATLNAIITLLTMRDMAKYGILLTIPREHLKIDDKIVADASKADFCDEEFRRICLSKTRLYRAQGMIDGQYPYDYIKAEIGTESPSLVSAALAPTIPPKTNVILVDKSPHQGYKMEVLKMEQSGPQIPFSFGVYPSTLPMTGSEGVSGINRKIIEMQPIEVGLDECEKDERVRNHIDSCISSIASTLNRNLYLAKILNSFYLPAFDVEWSLLAMKCRKAEARLNAYGKPSKVISGLLSMDLKFIDDPTIPLSKILQIREKEQTFEDFRIKLNELADELSSTPFTSKFKEEAFRIRREKIDPELRKIDREINRIKTFRSIRAFGGASIAIASITAGILGGGNLLSVLISTIASGKGFQIVLKEYSQYLKEKSLLKENPMFYLWRIKRSI